MSLSLGELEALCRKAARGAGLDWGPAEEAGRAVRRLAAFALPGAESLLARLEAFDRRPAQELSPGALDGEWRGGTALCPILTGAALADSADRLDASGEVVLHDVISPLLLIPFAGLCARRLGRPVNVAWSTLVVTDDGETLRLDGAREHLLDERADPVRCLAGADVEARSSEPLARVTRARMDADSLERLDTFARRTYAPATEDSRRRGAGDDDVAGSR